MMTRRHWSYNILNVNSISRLVICLVYRDLDTGLWWARLHLAIRARHYGLGYWQGSMLWVGRGWAASTPNLQGFCPVMMGLFTWQLLLTWPLTSMFRASLTFVPGPEPTSRSTTLTLFSSTSAQLVLSWNRPDFSACNYTYSVSAYPATNLTGSVSQSVSGTSGVTISTLSSHYPTNWRRLLYVVVTLTGLQRYTNYCASFNTT